MSYAQKDKAAMMRRLLGRIDAILASSMKTPLKLKPATDEEIAAAEKKFQLKFPPGRDSCQALVHATRALTSSLVCGVCGACGVCVQS
jgi:hypothetical protein